MPLKVKRQVLNSGLNLITVPMATDSVTVLLMVRVGSRDETSALNGLSHFVEHMVFKGTSKWPTAMAMNRAIDSVGGAFNAFTGEEYTGFWVKVAKKHLPLALEYVYQAVFAPLLPKDELERERGVILEEIKMYHDNPMSWVGRNFIAQIFGKSRLGQDVIGTAENIKAFKHSDFVSHMKYWYQSGNMILGVAGAIPENLEKQVEKIYSDLPAGKVKFTDKPEAVALKQTKARRQLIYRDIQQAHFCLGLPAFKQTDNRRYALDVLRVVLGGSTSSRLWDEIREKRGLVYYLRTMVDTFADTGYLVTQAGCDAKRIEEAIKVTLGEYDKITQGITSAELKLAKDYLKGKWALGTEDSQDVVQLFVAQLLQENQLLTVEEIVAKIDAVTLADVKKVAQDIFVKDKLNLTVLGPFKKMPKVGI